jgi:hypothetical protein
MIIESNVDPFPAADLATNRGGGLSDAQRKRLRGLARAGRKDEFIGALFCGALGAVLLSGVGPATSGLARPLIGVAFLAVAVVLLRVAVSGDAMTRDLRSGRVVRVEGAIGKHSVEVEGSHNRWTDYFIEVAGNSYSVDATAYRTAPEVGIVALYVLPRSGVILNLERLPDRPLPAGATASPAAAVGAAITSILSRDPTRAAEARAELAAIGSAVKAEHVGAATPPPAGERDPRPLAEAILGTWQTGPISMAFMPDGTMVATLPGGRRRDGRWSIGSDGRLHANASGRDEVNDAWVAGDTLTISQDGQGMAYRRAATSGIGPE